MPRGFVILGVNVDAMHEDVREREAKEEFFRDLDVALVALTRA